MTRRALIIGGSLGGLLAAHLLRAAGWRAIVFERNEEELTGRGVGLGTHPQLIAILRGAEIAFDETMGVKVRKVVCLDRAGNVIVEQPMGRVMSAWSRLYRALRERLPAQDYRLGKKLVRAEQDANTVTAIFADGAREGGDVLLGADGIRSTVREQFVPLARPVYAGYIAWRAVLDERELPRGVEREFFEFYTFCLPQREQLLGYPVPGRDNDTSIGRRAYNIVWYRPADPTAVADMSTDASGHHHASGIPPPLIRKDVIARVKSDAKALLAPQIVEIFLRAEPFFQPIFDLQSPALAFGRIALLGDAAFVARPHVGAGATKAAIDAAVLAKCLQSAGDAVASGLARYQQLQLPFGRDLVALSREQGEYLSGKHGAPHESREGRDIASLLSAHGTRSDQITAIVATRGLDAFL